MYENDSDQGGHVTNCLQCGAAPGIRRGIKREGVKIFRQRCMKMILHGQHAKEKEA